jgi:hypothetical protein
MAKTNVSSLDVDDHDGSTAGLYLAGVLVTATAAELNKASDYDALQTLAADGLITVRTGVCKIAKTVAGVVTATIAKPVAGTDDYKRLVIINFQTQQNTVAVVGGSFGNGGGNEDLATFSNVVGNTLCLIAYNGNWYFNGMHQCVIS